MIYIEPKDLWEKFEANKTILPGHYLACAEEDGKSIKLSVEEGGLLLIYDGDDGCFDETYDNEADAIYAYEEMLGWLSEPAESGPEDDPGVPEDPEISDQLLAATAAWLCVATRCKPEELNMSPLEIEDAARAMLWELGIEEGDAIA